MIVLVKFHIYLFRVNTLSVIVNDYDFLLNTLIILLLVHFPDTSQVLELVLIHLECCTDLVLRCIQVGIISFIPEPLSLLDFFFFPLWLVVFSEIRVLQQNGFIYLFRHLIVRIMTELT